ncbi:hypothetical protein M501DRAFT_1029365 [Patellaria atrata CBS 101060]|uniref:Uncharacterized protein n=1 Tax=Patellaria atrata CBS 101060 TaxID=1346257 RepID=A0A9P4SGP1_9PEZI|nr:hypothetical protein M501DRAFT_1029365 [Patellaria atrata CBS 101060]
MHEEYPHPLLAQVPLTVSPFLSLPTATPLPYSYKTLPSTLPPCSTSNVASQVSTSSGANLGSSDRDATKPAFVLSPSGEHAAHPDDIIASCQKLQNHLKQMQQEAEQTVRKWEERIRERDLAEKRRVAPGWLDTGASGVLEPERKVEKRAENVMDMEVDGQDEGQEKEGGGDREGEELDRAFGGMGI